MSTALDTEAKALISEATQHFYAVMDATRALDDLFGGLMEWRSARGTQSLHRVRNGLSRALGPRSIETEVTLERFNEGKSAATEHLEDLKARLKSTASLIKDLPLTKTPVVISNLVKARSTFSTGHRRILWFGDICLSAYEIELGKACTTRASGTPAIRRLNATSVTLISSDVSEMLLAHALKRLDQTFQIKHLPRFNATNADGVTVRTDRPIPNSNLTAGVNPFDPSQLSWMLKLSPLRKVIFDETGFPFEVAVPDIRAYALYVRYLPSIGNQAGSIPDHNHFAQRVLDLCEFDETFCKHVPDHLLEAFQMQ